jgi:thiol-disulfide isomerase/thioredoxin
MIDYKSYFEKGISYEKYLENIESELQSKIETAYSKYIPMNAQRMKRLEKTFILNKELVSVHTNIKWLVISENWCGDASQILPVINRVAESSDNKIELKIVYRDENAELIAQHLTNGSKSIPKLIQLTKDYKLISDWGPRPKTAQELVVQLKSNPETALTYSEELHKWYAKDKQTEILDELLKLVKH